MTIEVLREYVTKYGVSEAIRRYLILKNRAIAKKLITRGEVFVAQEAIDKLKEAKSVGKSDPKVTS